MDLNVVKDETLEILSRCKCCLDDVNLLHMWEESCYNGQTEIYGNMLSECFSFTWLVKTEKNQDDYICSSCVDRLHNALNFKREIIASEQVLREVQEAGISNNFNLDIKVETADTEDDNNYVEYLEMDSENGEDITQNKLSDEEPVKTHKRKWPKKRRGADRLKVYKKYTQLELRDALDAVKNMQMTPAEAAHEFNIPKNTIKNYVSKFSTVSEEQNESTEESIKDKSFRLIEEIKTLLTYTNAIPFKSKTAKYYCAYCSTDGPMFPDADELRIHTKNHEEERTERVDHFMRPYWLNEILKLDVQNLMCNICNTKLHDWNGMFQHFDTEHDIQFDEAYTKIVPYNLSEPIRCVLCHETFNNFHQIDGHMNAHYNNYICPECGDSFVAHSRLEKHVQVHNRGHFPCEQCGKVFSLDKYRLKHFNLVHKGIKVKCTFCPEKFTTELQRHAHILEEHKDHVKEYTCEYCGRVYTFKPYFLKHLQRSHKTVRKHKCPYCDKSFVNSSDLTKHVALHSRPKKYFCRCGDGFMTKIALQNHSKVHKNKVYS